MSDDFWPQEGFSSTMQTSSISLSSVPVPSNFYPNPFDDLATPPTNSITTSRLLPTATAAPASDLFGTPVDLNNNNSSNSNSSSSSGSISNSSSDSSSGSSSAFAGLLPSATSVSVLPPPPMDDEDYYSNSSTGAATTAMLPTSLEFSPLSTDFASSTSSAFGTASSDGLKSTTISIAPGSLPPQYHSEDDSGVCDALTS
jgi:hypothetical protein